ncbi:MAG TPA: condensation domain-containing protein, partial [Ktedonobacteraceae bacterium]|nr:condensation domain-containing protein [Ktedonobacteraceae bacterium]
GSTGELYIGGIGVARGYLLRAELTAERFVPDPFGEEPGMRLYRTGDLARYRQDGAIEYLGRIDHQVKLRGFRIELEEIEVCLRGYPGLRNAVVVIQDGSTGYSELIAYVVIGWEEATLREKMTDLRAYLRERLPEYMLPTHLLVLEQLPLTPSGKVDRRALPEVSHTDLFAPVEQIEAPRTVIEELLIELWQDLLGRAPIGRLANFFDLGGHSLLATQLLSRVKATFQIVLPLRVIFEDPTVAALARCIEQELGVQSGQLEAPLVPRPRTGLLPLSSSQQRLWFLENLEPGSPAYHVPAAVRLYGSLRVDVLQQCLLRLIERHESLRTTFHQQEGVPYQRVHSSMSLSWREQDLSDWPEETRGIQVARLLQQDWHRPFHLEEGPLLRALLLRLGEQEYIFLLTLHHLVTDAWSNSVLLEELTQFYAELAQGREIELADMPIQYADYALWQQDWLASAGIQEQLSYWRQQLTGVVPLQLPTDRPRPAILSNQGAEYRWMLPTELVEQLRQTCREEGVTLFMLLLGALQIMLAKTSGQEDIAVGTLIANRSRVECERLVGFLVNALVMRTDLSGAPNFREIIRRVREVCLGAYAHQDLPFEKLVEELQPERDLSRSPLFQVLLVLQNTPSVTWKDSELRAELLPTEHKTSLHDLMFMLSPEDQNLLCIVRYNTDLFEEETIIGLLERWREVLQALTYDVEQPALRASSLLSASQLLQLETWNQTDRPYPLHRSFSQL